MRVVYLSTATIPSTSANSIHVMRMCQAFGHHGHTLRLIACLNPIHSYRSINPFSYYGIDNNFDIKLLRWPSLCANHALFAIQSLFFLFLWRPNLVIGRNLAACLLACILGAPTIFESHSPIDDEGKYYTLLFNLLIRLPSFRGLVVITHTLSDYYLQRSPSLHDKILVAPDGADLVPAGTLPYDLQNTRQRLQVGYIGNLYPGKCMEIIIPLCKLCPWADFHIVGGSTEQFLTWFTAQPIPINLTHHLHKPPNIISRYMLAMDVLLLPNQNYVQPLGGDTNIGPWTSPLKAFEYMASGRAIICSDLPVLREFAIHNHNTILCSPESPEQWSICLSKLSKDPGLRKALGNAARLDVELHYTWSKRVSRILTHFPNPYYHALSPHQVTAISSRPR